MSAYRNKLDDPEFFKELTLDYVRNEIAPRVAKALEDYGSGRYDVGEIHSAEIEALLMAAEGRIK